MNVVLLLVNLFILIQSIRPDYVPVLLEESLIEDLNIPVDQCIEGCSDSPILVLREDEDSHVISKRSTADALEVILSGLSSILNYFYRLFIQPWAGMMGIGNFDGNLTNSSFIDRNFYTVEGRSALDASSPPSVDWRSFGAAVFDICSKFL